ncbi:hypothetical protein SAMN05428964_11319 [Thalassospira xiamenensis]|uniref:Uncharacterized protein n=2 Tax=Thalassospira xiamenensis TaxID=220697 RepID=A0A285TY57_9PROT|nr:hypothetical protein SAMN05428964_11319 [Thalassospira xiamenensis]
MVGCGAMFTKTSSAGTDASYLGCFTKWMLKVTTSPCHKRHLNRFCFSDPRFVGWLDYLLQSGWTIRVAQPRNFLVWSWTLENGRYADPVIILPTAGSLVRPVVMDKLFACLMARRMACGCAAGTINDFRDSWPVTDLFAIIGTQDQEAIADILSASLLEITQEVSVLARISEQPKLP